MLHVEWDSNNYNDAELFLYKWLSKLHDEFTFEHLLGWIKEGQLSLAVVYIDNIPVAAAVLQKVVFPKHKALYVQGLGGIRLAEWEYGFIKLLQEYAILQNFDSIRIQGRKGWGRALTKFGFNTSYYYEKEV